MTWTRTILDLKDGNGTIQPVVAYTDGTNYSFAHPLLDNTGAIIAPAVQTGSVDLVASPSVTAGAYAAGANVGGLITLSGATRIAAGSGIINSVIVTVSTALTAFYDVVLFKTAPTSTITDNVAFNLNQLTDLPYICGTAHCNDQTSLGTPNMFQAVNLGYPFSLSASNTNLYAAIILRGAQTLPSTSAINLIVNVLQN
jgi:hypothetical protein